MTFYYFSASANDSVLAQEVQRDREERERRVKRVSARLNCIMAWPMGYSEKEIQEVIDEAGHLQVPMEYFLWVLTRWDTEKSHHTKMAWSATRRDYDHEHAVRRRQQTTARRRLKGGRKTAIFYSKIAYGPKRSWMNGTPRRS